MEDGDLVRILDTMVEEKDLGILVTRDLSHMSSVHRQPEKLSQCWGWSGGSLKHWTKRT